MDVPSVIAIVLGTPAALVAIVQLRRSWRGSDSAQRHHPSGDRDVAPEGGLQAPQEQEPLVEAAHLPSEGFQVTFPGPFEHHDVVVNGWRVPFLQAHLAADRVRLVLDRRLAADLSLDEAERVVPFVADAIAVALGYGAHPDDDTPRPLPRAPYPRPERVVGIAPGEVDELR